HQETRFVTGVDAEHGGSGDPSPVTAFGTYQGIRASVKRKLGRDSLKGIRVALQGVGSVGWNLAKLLKQDGATVIISDIDHDRCRRAETELKIDGIVGPDEITLIDAEVFAPC